jgi:hypothetical protein
VVGVGVVVGVDIGVGVIEVSLSDVFVDTTLSIEFLQKLSTMLFMLLLFKYRV